MPTPATTPGRMGMEDKFVTIGVFAFMFCTATDGSIQPKYTQNIAA
jgi:hypothetical protein